MRYKFLTYTAAITVFGLTALTGARAGADDTPAAPAEQEPTMTLPPGWTEADMQACARAATPGKMQAFLARGAGVWKGQHTMWMTPDADPVTSPCTATASVIMGGRYLRVKHASAMPGMGPFNGMGLYGYDNVAEKFVSIWIDDQSTGIMTGEGELSADEKTLTWRYDYNCPITGKGSVMREVEHLTGPDSKTLEMFGTDPKSGNEYKIIRIELTRTSDNPRPKKKK